ncbi:MAG: hypothetical protein EON58_20225 [Alphaproteobacteria bacterium]|nr:MAG: hypothetical protein EON58_20225 [Alphaproteobacteria bacterium]
MLCLSHTNKNPTASGKLKYAGTADLVQDLDAGYVITPLPGDAGETVTQFVSEKNRGGGAESVAYSYANDRAISYEERLASVRLVDPEQLGQFQKQSVKRSDEELINAIRASILAGIVKKMALSKAAAAKAGSSQREAIRVLERYTGSEPEQHHWTYAVREQGAKIFELLAPAV